MAKDYLKFDYTKLRQMPAIVRALCFSHEAWVVGGSAKWLVGEQETLRDWDIIVPSRCWQDAQHLIPHQTPSNTFGGYKIAGEVEVDVWCEDLDHYFTNAHAPNLVAVQPRRQKVARLD